VPVVYADASALVKLVRDEPESGALRSYLSGTGTVTSELALTEVPRAVRRAAADDPGLPLERLLDRAGEVVETVGLLPLDRGILLAAGAIAEPGLRALDAIHVAAAVSLAPIDAFVTYDERQAAAARIAGLRVIAPGA
jgi:predicted nucleic acid-binding protein